MNRVLFQLKMSSQDEKLSRIINKHPAEVKNRKGATLYQLINPHL